MAITRLLQSGFELGSKTVECGVPNSVFDVNTTAAHTGTYSARVAAGGLNCWAYYPIAAISQARCAFHFRHNGLGAAEGECWALTGGTLVACFTWDGTNLTAYCGATQVEQVAYPAFGTLNTWMHIGIDVKIDAAAGWFYLYVNGSEAIGYDGQTNQGAASFNRLYLGNFTSNTLYTNYAYVDDLYLDNSTGEAGPVLPPDLRFNPVYLDGSGYSSQFTGSDGDSVNNYALVDERPPDTADYVYTAATGQIDGYTLSDYTPTVLSSVAAVIPTVYGRRGNASAPALKLGTRVGGANVTDAVTAPLVADGLVWTRQTAKPGGGSWSEADVDGAEMVVESA